MRDESTIDAIERLRIEGLTRIKELARLEAHCHIDDCCGPGSWCCQRAASHTHTSDGAAVFPKRDIRPVESESTLSASAQSAAKERP